MGHRFGVWALLALASVLDATAGQPETSISLAGTWRFRLDPENWPATNYQIVGGLAAYGSTGWAADMCDETISNAIKQGISEYHDSVSGAPLGIRDYRMSCTLVTMMLDGLPQAHRLKIRTKGQPRMTEEKTRQ